MVRRTITVIVTFALLILVTGCASSTRTPMDTPPPIPLPVHYDIRYADRTALSVELMVLVTAPDRTSLHNSGLQRLADESIVRVTRAFPKSELITQQVRFREELQRELAARLPYGAEAQVVLVSMNETGWEDYPSVVVSMK